MAVVAGERDFELSTVFALTIKALLRRPVTALLLAAVTLTLPTELYLRLVPYVPAAFSVSFVLYTLGSFAAFSPAAVLTGWMALDASGEERPLLLATKRALSLSILYFIVTTVGMLGLLAFIVPGILWSLATAVAIPAAAVGRLSMKDAILRSFDLTKDRRAIIFVISIVVMLPPVMAIGLFELAMNGWQLLPTQENPIITNITRPVTDTLVGMWGAALGAALYVDLVRVVGDESAGGVVADADVAR
jgi:hypothetical protein